MQFSSVVETRAAYSRSEMTKTLKKKIIVVLGMHRSGTSAVARSLQVFQIDLGDKLMPAAEGNNPKGFWEDLEINALNEEMLRAIDAGWHHFSRVKLNHVALLRKAGFFDRAVALLMSKTSVAPAFGFKDPRTTKLLPFWKPVFARCDFQVKYVLVVRHPMSVMKSLAKREGFVPEKSYMLWLAHVLEGLTGTNQTDRVLVDYDRLIENPERELNRVSAALGMSISADKLEEFKIEFLDTALRHTVYKPLELKKDIHCPPLVGDIYQELLKVAADKDSLDSTRFQSVLAKWEQEFARHENISNRADRLDIEKTALAQSITYRDAQINVLTEKLTFLEVESRKSPCESAFYFTVENNESAFSETNKLRQFFELSGKFETLEFDFPACSVPYSRLRWDPADCPCVLDIQTLEVFNFAGDILWEAETPANCFRVFNEQVLVMLRPDALASILCFGVDPNLQLVLPQNVLDQLSKEGGKLRWKLRGRRIDNTAVFAAQDFRVMLRSELEPPHWAASMTNVLSAKLDHGNGQLAQLALGFNDSAVREQHLIEKISALATQTELEQARLQDQFATVHLQFARDAAELLKAQTRATDLQSTLTAREGEFGETLRSSQQESRALVQSLTEQLEGSRQNAFRLTTLLESIQKVLAEREREFSERLRLNQQESQSLVQSVTEQLHESQTTLLAREREFGERLELNQQTSLVLIGSLTVQLEGSRRETLGLAEFISANKAKSAAQMLSAQTALSELQLTIAACEREVDFEIGHMKAEITQLNQTLRGMEQDLAAKSRELNAIKTSAAWKVLAPMRWIGRVGS